MRGRIDSRGHLTEASIAATRLIRRHLCGIHYEAINVRMRRSMSEFGDKAEVAPQSDEGRC